MYRFLHKDSVSYRWPKSKLVTFEKHHFFLRLYGWSVSLKRYFKVHNWLVYFKYLIQAAEKVVNFKSLFDAHK